MRQSPTFNSRDLGIPESLDKIKQEGVSSSYVDLDSIVMSGLEDEGDFKSSFFVTVLSFHVLNPLNDRG